MTGTIPCSEAAQTTISPRSQRAGARKEIRLHVFDRESREGRQTRAEKIPAGGCWLRVMDENGINMDFSDDDIEGDYPVCCQSYTTNEGDEHVELCGRHAELAADTTLPAVEKWKGELNVLYGEWLAASREGDRAAIAFSQAFFTLWLEQQTHALQYQNAENVDSSIEAILRNHCVGLCRTVFELTIE